MSMSSEDSFSSLGKIEAINNLLSSAGLKRESNIPGGDRL